MACTILVTYVQKLLPEIRRLVAKMQEFLLYATVFSCSLLISFTLTMIAFGVFLCISPRTVQAQYDVLEDSEYSYTSNDDPTSFVFNVSDDNWAVSKCTIYLSINWPDTVKSLKNWGF